MTEGTGSGVTASRTLRHVGVDLAWGPRRPTGIAVLDRDGRLLEVGTATSDEEIVEALRDHVEGPCVVAFDAPLLVTNPTGNRPAERALNRDFAAFDAGTHPVNTSRPEFTGGSRALALATRLGLDPYGRGTRRALEVYPHAASVALFGLGRTLKYKHKQGRDLPLLRSELLRLVALIDGLADADPPLDLATPAWGELRSAVASATRKSELRRAEDPIDAVLCAYVAQYADRRPADVTTYGDPDEGAITTPTLPPGLSPSPR